MRRCRLKKKCAGGRCCWFLLVAVAGFGGADFLLLQFSWGEKKEKKKWKSDSRREWPVPQDDAVNC